MCVLFHKWSKWEQYEDSYTKIPIGIIYPKEIRGQAFQATDKRQKRTCLKCGKVQDVLVGK